MERSDKKRSRSASPPPWQRHAKSPRYEDRPAEARPYPGRGRGGGRGQGGFQNHYQRRNQEQEDRQMREWMAQEDDFVLKQSKKKARIRIQEGRAKPIDSLVLILSIVDPSRDPLEDDFEQTGLDVQDPVVLMDSLEASDLHDLEKEIDHYIVLEHNESNLTFWEALKTICKQRRKILASNGPGRGIGSVSTDVDRLLSPKSLQQLQTLESQVHQKLRSDEAIDEEYWEQLLESIILYKAKAHMKVFYTSVQHAQLKEYRMLQILAAQQEQALLNKHSSQNGDGTAMTEAASAGDHDPMPSLKLPPDAQHLEAVDEEEFKKRILEARLRIKQSGYVTGRMPLSRIVATQASRPLQGTSNRSEDHSSTTRSMYDREAEKGMEEDEEVFGVEDEVSIESNPLVSGKYRPRKPKHFNRVQMGYEWNKYNQTHYDHDNPPPKVVQGYKFNIFYPDLIDKVKAPTYRIERENGRKKGQSLAPAGEEDTCIIRFIGGPPYEDIAFRIVDREWDYSAKYERGFKSSFDKGILQLHFQFKKIYYRK